MAASDDPGPTMFEKSATNPETGDLGDATDVTSTGLCVDDAGALIAAIPAMLRFTPTRSLVVPLLGTDSGRDSDGPQFIQAVMRFDIDAVAAAAGVRYLADVLKLVCQRENMTSMMMIIVDDHPAASATANELLRHLNGAGIEPTHAWLVATITSGIEYQDLLTIGHGGLVDDPYASAVAFAHVLDGKQISGSREELADLFSTNSDLTAQVRPYLDSAAASYRTSLATATDRGEAHRRNSAEWILAQISAVGDAPPTASDLATIVALLRDRIIGAVMFGLGTTGLRGQAERLWRHVASATEGLDRAEAITLFGYSAYLSGNAVVAAIAIASALQEDPDHTVASLLEVALQDCIRPDDVHMLAEIGHTVAAELDLDITTDAQLCNGEMRPASGTLNTAEQ